MVQISQIYYNNSAELSFFETQEINLKRTEDGLRSGLTRKLTLEEDIHLTSLLMSI
ncbi:MAG: hypothetical protein ACR2IS_06675 [Nitrososphaeraceae archaeon]